LQQPCGRLIPVVAAAAAAQRPSGGKSSRLMTSSIFLETGSREVALKEAQLQQAVVCSLPGSDTATKA